jgi:hypothetical protein
MSALIWQDYDGVRSFRQMFANLLREMKGAQLSERQNFANQQKLSLMLECFSIHVNSLLAARFPGMRIMSFDTAQAESVLFLLHTKPVSVDLFDLLELSEGDIITFQLKGDQCHG